MRPPGGGDGICAAARRKRMRRAGRSIGRGRIGSRSRERRAVRRSVDGTVPPPLAARPARAVPRTRSRRGGLRGRGSRDSRAPASLAEAASSAPSSSGEGGEIDRGVEPSIAARVRVAAGARPAPGARRGRTQSVAPSAAREERSRGDRSAGDPREPIFPARGDKPPPRRDATAARAAPRDEGDASAPDIARRHPARGVGAEVDAVAVESDPREHAPEGPERDVDASAAPRIVPTRAVVEGFIIQPRVERVYPDLARIRARWIAARGTCPVSPDATPSLSARASHKLPRAEGAVANRAPGAIRALRSPRAKYPRHAVRSRRGRTSSDGTPRSDRVGPPRLFAHTTKKNSAGTASPGSTLARPPNVAPPADVA